IPVIPFSGGTPLCSANTRLPAAALRYGSLNPSSHTVSVHPRKLPGWPNSQEKNGTNYAREEWRSDFSGMFASSRGCGTWLQQHNSIIIHTTVDSAREPRHRDCSKASFAVRQHPRPRFIVQRLRAMNYQPQFPPPKAKLFLSHYSFLSKKPRHQAIIFEHPFNHEAEVFIPNLSIPEVSLIFSGMEGFYYRVDLPLSFFITQKVINHYVRFGSLVAQSIGGGIDTDDVVGLEGKVPPYKQHCALAYRKISEFVGNLILSVTKDTYEQLGLPGKLAQFGPNKQRFIVQIDLTAKSMVPGKKGYDRIKWCFENTFVKKFTFFIASINPSTGATEEIEFPDDVKPLKIPVEKAIHELRSISIPDLSGIKVISAEDRWRNEALDIYEWLGLASLRAKRCSVNIFVTFDILYTRRAINLSFVIDQMRRISATDRVDSYISVYHSPEPNTQGTGCMIRWTGFIPTFLLENIFTLLRYASYIFDLLLLQTGPERFLSITSSILLSPRNSIKLAQIPWASFTVWGFQDSPVSWRRREHGHLISGENHYTFVMWPDETISDDITAHLFLFLCSVWKCSRETSVLNVISTMEVHRCRFVDYQPASINALSYTPPTTTPTLLACGRANGNIEIWSPRSEWNLDKVIPGGANMSVEALVFTHQTILTDEEYDTEEEKATARKRLLVAPPRLFSAGLNAHIMEWNLNTLKAERYVDSHGGAIWCMTSNHTNTVLAVGCEDGCVRLFDIADGELSFIRSFDKQKGRILSIAWSSDDKHIVTGSADSSIRKWDVSRGRTINRMTVDKRRKEDTLVWAISVLADGTIVSGDSLGHVKFWDGKLGTMLQTFNAHGADVLCLASSRDGRTVFTSGVDRKLNQFRLVETALSFSKQEMPPNDSPSEVMASARTKWVLSGNRRFHSHDVRALALEENRPINALVSGGIDMSLVVSPAREFPNSNQRRLPFLPQKPLVSISKSKRLMLCRFTNALKVWRLGKTSSPTQSYHEMSIGAYLELVEPQQAVLEMSMKVDRNITASALSEDGRWIAIADIEETRLFRVEDDPKQPGRLLVRKQKHFAKSLVAPPSIRSTGAHQLLFTPDSSKLVIGTTDSQVFIIDLSRWQEQRYEVLRRFGQHRGMGESDEMMGESYGDEQVSTIVSMATSPDGQWLSTGDLLNRIHVFNLDALQYLTTLPTFDSTHTTLTFHPYQPSTLIISLVSNEFYLYDVELRRLTDWSRQHSQQLPTKFLELKDKIMGFGFNPARPSTITAWGVTYLCLIDLAKDVGDRNAVLNVNKRKRIKQHRDDGRKETEERRSKRHEQGGIAVPTLEPLEPVELGPVEEEKGDPVNFQLLFKYQPLMFLDFMGPDSMVVVERPMFGILEKLPPSFYKAKYGT
ncbi:hypothetical protein BC937DRAFT_92478, partial [Endogone sp. FLAS-F59071]